ncbi:hypothetical protein [Methanoplanus limicola]|uniref:hypothetical protein n=1 Tax=Methanoplanus limicola TaxID=2315 RepID=UPI00064FB799|nr:hypothetical protein [Methanoplanus limicola]
MKRTIRITEIMLSTDESAILLNNGISVLSGKITRESANPGINRHRRKANEALMMNTIVSKILISPDIR